FARCVGSATRSQLGIDPGQPRQGLRITSYASESYSYCPHRGYNTCLGGHFMPDADLQKPDWLLQMENILETLNEGVVITDDALRVVFTNEALLRLTGSERGE